VRTDKRVEKIITVRVLSAAPDQREPARVSLQLSIPASEHTLPRGYNIKSSRKARQAAQINRTAADSLPA
jgi:hypothetical protein